MVKKIAIISDTHGFVHPDIIRLIARCDIAIHAGDVVLESVLDKLKPLEKLIVVAGNNDSHITHLNDIAILHLFGNKIVVEHGHKHGHHQVSHQSLRKAHNDAKLIIYGHTHKQIIDKKQTPWVVNPGAAGETRTNGGASCLVLEASANKQWNIEPFRFIDN